MSEPLSKQLRREIRGFIEDEVLAGFEPPAEIVEDVVAVFSDDAPAETLRPLAGKLVARAIERHLEAQAEWPEVTDNDRLDAAFAELEEQYGILARQNYNIDLTGGHTDLQAEVAQAREQGRTIRGYTFYHAQDTQLVLETDVLHLAFGTLATDEEIARALLSTWLENGEAPTNPEQPLHFKQKVIDELREKYPDLSESFTSAEMLPAIKHLIKDAPMLDRLGMMSRSPKNELAVFKLVNDVVDVLQRHGLDVTWDGVSHERVEVKMDWKRRR